MLLWTDRCCTSPPALLLLSPAVPLSLSPCGIALSIHSPLPLPSLCFHPSLLVWPTAPFRFAQGERVPCVCCLAACPLSSSPSFSPTSSFPLLSLFPLSSFAFHPCPILYSSSLPPLLHPSPRTSLCPRHSLHLLLITPPPSLSLCASIHTSFSVFLSPLPPHLPPPLPSLLLGWAQEQWTGVVSFWFGCVRINAVSSAVKTTATARCQSVWGWSCHLHTHTHTPKHPNIRTLRCKRARTHTQTGWRAHVHTHANTGPPGLL